MVIASDTSKVCSADVWLLTFLGTLLIFSYGAGVIATPEQWVGWPITISLCSAVVSLVGLEIAARRLPTPQAIKGMRRAALYIAAFVIGIILNYAITPVRTGSRGFRVGIFMIFGLPFFVWLLDHVRKHHQARPRLIVVLCTLVLAVFYLAATMLSPTQ
jgi:preprotein translocase subunit Sec61beta